MKRLSILLSITLLLFLLGSCNKEEISNEFPLSTDLTTQARSSRDFTDFEQAFLNQKNMVNKDSISVMNPLLYNLDMSSAIYVERTENQSVVINTYQSVFEETDWIRNQVLIQKKSEGGYEVKTLLYIADETFYQEKQYNPLLVNFTGKVLEYSTNEEVTNIYTLHLGGVKDTYPEIIALHKECPSAEGGGTDPSWWEEFTGWWRGVWTLNGGAGSGTTGQDATNIGGQGGGGNGGAGGSNGGSGGGGSTGNTNICENQSLFWSQYDIEVKKNYINALSIVLTNLSISACHDPFTTDGPCEVTYSEVLCGAENFDCIVAGATENDLVECLSALMDSMDEELTDLACENAIALFQSTYALTLTLSEITALEGISSCGEIGFTEQAIELLYSMRIDDLVTNTELVYQDENFNIYDIVPKDCVFENDFNSCAFEAIDSFWHDLLVDIYPELLIPSHVGSFPMTRVNESYYCQTNFINLGFWHEFNPSNFVTFCIPDLCIQIPYQNTEGPFNIHDVPRNTKEAFDNTRRALLIMAWEETITTTAEGRVAFIQRLEEELASIFKVDILNVSVNQLNCNNGAESSNYGINLLGYKGSPDECIYD